MATIRDYFRIDELVCKHVADKFGDAAWSFFDPRLLEVLLFVREGLDKEIYVNLPDYGLYQRGLRCNLCSLVKDRVLCNILYCSPHVRGQAVDFSVKEMSAVSVRAWLIQHKSDLPYAIRLESSVEWVHLDVSVPQDVTDKITYF
jgi:hypothetical protein